MSINYFDMVKEFHDKFGIPSRNVPAFPSIAERELRQKLYEEEYIEYRIGEERNDLSNVAKELADGIYIILGTALSYGIDMDKVFGEVHRSNMSKLDENGEVLRREDGKVLKSNLYSPADIDFILFGSNV